MYSSNYVYIHVYNYMLCIMYVLLTYTICPIRRKQVYPQNSRLIMKRNEYLIVDIFIIKMVLVIGRFI